MHNKNPSFIYLSICEGGIERYVSMINVRHRVEACQAITIGDPEGCIFYLILLRIMDPFSCSPVNAAFFKKKAPRSSRIHSIGTASANSAKFRGIGPQMYIEDLL